MRSEPLAAALRRVLLRKLAALVILLSFGIVAAPAQATPTPAETVWRLLDYVAVDYGGAVKGGQVINAAEYAEMKEFSATARSQIASLPGTSAHPQLAAEAARLELAISAKADPATVSTQARQLAGDLLAAYPVPLAPQSAPNLARGAALYQEQCAACHGANGAGDGANARGLDPPPIAFIDRERASHRSLFGLYQVIDQGLDGTAMPSFAHLPSDDRWALAFYVGRFAYDDAAAQRGERRWREDPKVRAAFPDLAALTRVTPASMVQSFGAAGASEITAYLRRSPEALASTRPATLAVARTQLAAALKAYAAGNRSTASDLALSTYLDGVEPVEPALAAKDRELLVRIETAMSELRNRIGHGAPVAEVQAQAAVALKLFDEAEAQLGQARGDRVSAFVGAFTVLLREGLEALLIVVAMIAFLRKAERQDVLPYVHGGWIAALAAGAATWGAATYLVTISGASRELTEGFGSLLAAVVLVSVGVWMHGKSQADAWQRYIREKLSRALSRQSAWFLFLLSFVVVYREVFETILFYAALWNSGSETAVLGGATTAIAMLALIAWAMLRFSRKLPIGTFFAASAGLVAVLAVVLVGKGVAALQEAGMIGVAAVAGAPRVEILGLYGTLQTLGAQLAVLVILVGGFIYNRRAAMRRSSRA